MIPLKNVSFFPSDCHFVVRATYPPSLFSGTRYVLRNNVFRHVHRNTKLFMVCKQCWIHVRHISMVCEPYWGCKFFDNIGFELDIL